MDVDGLDRILRERGVEIERTKLEAALDDASFKSWASLHLTPATLLTPDELATYVTCLSHSPSVPPRHPRDTRLRSNPKTSYTALSDSGAIKNLELTSPGDLPLPRDQAELQSAIEEINRSTEAIARQTETLRQQQEALARFARGRISDEGRRDEVQASRGHAVAVETRELRAAVCHTRPVIFVPCFSLSPFPVPVIDTG